MEELEQVKRDYGKHCTVMKRPGGAGFTVVVRLPEHSGCSLKFQLPGEYPTVAPEILFRGSETLSTEKAQEVSSLLDRLASDISNDLIIKKTVEAVLQQLTVACNMRSCSDVVKRILEDDKLPKEHFNVGYLDRLKGILEKDFSEFSWSDQEKSDGTVLAVPHHRVLYFAYKGRRVWDRGLKLDLLFGCDSGNKSIYDVITEVDETGTEDVNSSKVKVKPGQPSHFICLRIRENGILEKMADLQEEIMRIEPICAEYFVAPAKAHITLCVMKIESEEELSNVITCLQSINLELFDMAKKQPSLRFKGVGHFYNSVLFGKVDNPKTIADICSHIKSHLSNAGINMKGNFGKYTPHLTIFKGVDKEAAKRGGDYMVTLQERFKNFDFGCQDLDELHLCPMGHAQSERPSDGFYQSLASIPLLGNDV